MVGALCCSVGIVSATAFTEVHCSVSLLVLGCLLLSVCLSWLDHLGCVVALSYVDWDKFAIGVVVCCYLVVDGAPVEWHLGLIVLDTVCSFLLFLYVRLLLHRLLRVGGTFLSACSSRKEDRGLRKKK
jgi:hypothetical protein